MRYRVWIQGVGDTAEIDAPTADDAAHEYVHGVDRSSWYVNEEDEHRTIAVECYSCPVTDDEYDDDEDEEDDCQTHLVLWHPPEPPCRDGSDHAWGQERAWGIGGCGVRVHETCETCGLVRVTRTATQPVETIHDHESVAYARPEHGEGEA